MGAKLEAWKEGGVRVSWDTELVKIFLSFFLRFYLFSFGEGKGGRNINVWLPLVSPPLGTWPAAQACALTGNRTRDPLVHRHTQATEPYQPGLN